MDFRFVVGKYQLEAMRGSDDDILRAAISAKYIFLLIFLLNVDGTYIGRIFFYAIMYT